MMIAEHSVDKAFNLNAGIADENLQALVVLGRSLLRLPTDPVVPTSAMALLLGVPELAAALTSDQPREGLCTLHETQRFLDCRPDTPSVRKAITLKVNGSSDVAQYNVTLPETGEAMETRLRYVPKETVRATKAPHFHGRLCSDGALRLQTLPLSAARLGEYVALAGDANPIHVDRTAAKHAGFEDVIAPGMMLCILAEMACCKAMQIARMEEVRARFLSPALAGQPVTMIFAPTSGGPRAKMRVFVVGPREELHAIVDFFSARF